MENLHFFVANSLFSINKNVLFSSKVDNTILEKLRPFVNQMQSGEVIELPNCTLQQIQTLLLYLNSTESNKRITFCNLIRSNVPIHDIMKYMDLNTIKECIDLIRTQPDFNVLLDMFDHSQQYIDEVKSSILTNPFLYEPNQIVVLQQHYKPFLDDSTIAHFYKRYCEVAIESYQPNTIDLNYFLNYPTNNMSYLVNKIYTTPLLQTPARSLLKHLSLTYNLPHYDFFQTNFLHEHRFNYSGHPSNNKCCDCGIALSKKGCSTYPHYECDKKSSQCKDSYLCITCYNERLKLIPKKLHLFHNHPLIFCSVNDYCSYNIIKCNKCNKPYSGLDMVYCCFDPSCKQNYCVCKSCVIFTEIFSLQTIKDSEYYLINHNPCKIVMAKEVNHSTKLQSTLPQNNTKSVKGIHKHIIQSSVISSFKSSIVSFKPPLVSSFKSSENALDHIPYQNTSERIFPLFCSDDPFACYMSKSLKQPIPDCDVLLTFNLINTTDQYMFYSSLSTTLISLSKKAQRSFPVHENSHPDFHSFNINDFSSLKLLQLVPYSDVILSVINVMEDISVVWHMCYSFLKPNSKGFLIAPVEYLNLKNGIIELFEESFKIRTEYLNYYRPCALCEIEWK